MYKFLALTAVLLLLEQTAELLYRNSSRYKNSRSGYEHIHGKIPDGLEIVNVGSGPGLHAIDYAYSSRKGFNFATAPQNFLNGFRLLKRFSSNIRPHAVVMIVIMSPLSFGRNNDYNSPGYSDKFYGVLPPSDIDGYSPLRALLLKHFPLMRRILAKIRSKFSRPGQSAPKLSHPDNEPGLITTWKREFDLQNLTDPSQAHAHRQVFAEKIALLSEEIDYCKAHQWHPVFVIPPVPAKSRKFISNEFVKAFVYDNLQVLAEKYPDVKILDYFADERMTPEMFSGDIFVNSEGRKTFSRILFADIDSIEKEAAE
ncbi:MAG: hypothetical protein IJS39_08785 [Synergistaceae bacterium]|nr:hypothetical protein [Synergistaceae bacterium]